MPETVQPAEHSVILQNRTELSLTGITDVTSFDDETILLSASLGEMVIKGKGLRIVEYDTDTGRLKAEGTFFSLGYRTDAVRESWLKRLAR